MVKEKSPQPYEEFSENGLPGFIERLRQRIKLEKSLKKPNRTITKEGRTLIELAQDLHSKHAKYRDFEKKWVSDWERALETPENLKSDKIVQDFTLERVQEFNALEASWLETEGQFRDKWQTSCFRQEEVVEAQRKVEQRVASSEGGKSVTPRWYTPALKEFVRALIGEADAEDESIPELWDRAKDWADSGHWYGYDDRKRDLCVSVEISDGEDSIVFANYREGQIVSKRQVQRDAFRKAVNREDKLTNNPSRHRGR